MKRYAFVIVAVISILVIAYSDTSPAYGTGVAEIRPDLTVKVEKETQAFDNGNGVAVSPLSYNDTTYLPVRSIGRMMEKAVTWDEESSTIYIEGDGNYESIPNLDLTGAERAKTDVTIRPDITILIDKQKFTLDDGNGNEIYPISYNNTTYLPVRAVGNALGKEVHWDASQQTIYIGSYLTSVEEVGKLSSFETLFSDLQSLSGVTYSVEGLDRLHTKRLATLYDEVEPAFPLLLKTDSNGRANVIYDLYISAGEDGELLNINKNFCSLFPSYKGTTDYNALVTDIVYAWFFFESPTGGYIADPERFEEYVDMTESMVINDIAEYQIKIPECEYPLKKVILELVGDSGYEMYIAFDADSVLRK